jgi:high-affinity iron transporter
VDAFAITLREGIEAALVLGIILAMLARDGRPELSRWVVAGAAAAGLFSIGAAAALASLGLTAENPFVDGVLYAVAAVVVVAMVVWMRRSAKGAGAAVKSRVGRITGAGRSAAAIGAGLFGLAFFTVAREGVETALFLSAAALSGNGAAALVAGGLAGLSLAVLYGVLLARGSARIDLKLFFAFTSVVLLLLGVKLLGTSIHEFEEAGVIPMSEAMAHFFDGVAQSTAVDWLFLVALAVPFAAPVVRRWRATSGASPA